jgi:hypothetical protein
MRGKAFLVFAVLLMVGCPRKNHAPDAPSVPVGPSVVPEDSTASFASAATDPDNDSVCIRFDWGDGDTTAWGPRVPTTTRTPAAWVVGDDGKSKASWCRHE